MKADHLILKYLLIVFILVAGTVNSESLADISRESNDKILNEKAWKRLTKKIDYSENYKEFKKKDKTKKRSNTNLQKKRSWGGFKFGNTQVWKTLLIVLVTGVLAFLLYLILVRYLNFFEERVTDKRLSNIIDNLEDNIHESDFDRLLRQALNSKSYKLAVRILYVKIIKTLSDKELIQWKREKTNGHYVREMAGNPQGGLFAYLTIAYEQVWFGNYEIDDSKYSLISKQFNNLLNKLD